MDITYCYEKCSVGKAASERFLQQNNSALDAATDFRFFTEECAKTCIEHGAQKERSFMKYMVGKNDTGKTRALIKQSLDTDVPIFVLYDSKAESLRAKAYSYFGKSVRVITPQDFAVNGYTGDILVDDMDKAFNTLLAAYIHSYDFNVVGATLTED